MIKHRHTVTAAAAGIADIVAGRFTLIDGPQYHARLRDRLAARLDAFAAMQKGSRHHW